ncbi:MAG TPA: peptidoglycan-binding domain-containing protein [Xanthobacteraceae bacterium]|jgi:peptidoglycan hydrolase-like protein with peptidoglycan-binding domain|nr:peptidoglycan-binding domain-containing protein [Xanthobacteraceae bacterium]
MHKAMLAALAVAALSGPAVAQQGGLNGQSATGQHMQPQSRTSPDSSDSSQVLAGYQISPQQLSSSQVHQIQQALEARGHSAVRVNGEWGPDTEAALKDFQKSQNITWQTGQLDLPTIMALGLDPSSFGLAGANETTGQAPRGGVTEQQMPGMPRPPMPQSGGRQGK